MGTASRNLVILLIDVLVIVFIDCHLALTSSVRSSLLEFLHVFQCSNEAASGAKNQEQEQAGSGAEASTGSQELLKSLLSGASV